MGKTSIPFIIFGSVLILALSMFYSPNFLPLLVLVLLYAVWELWDEYVAEIKAEQKEHEKYMLYDPVYQLLIM
ncbi:MAG: hypothetical protein ACTSRK_03200 [Promethearchaeota archaeon]